MTPHPILQPYWSAACHPPPKTIMNFLSLPNAEKVHPLFSMHQCSISIQNNIPFTNVWHFICPFVCWWTFGVFLPFGYHAAMNFCVQVFTRTYDFVSLQCILKSEFLGLRKLSAFKVLSDCIPRWLRHFIHPVEMYEKINFSTSSLHLL